MDENNLKATRLWGKNVWKSYPDRMLQMRARGFALRDSFPDVLKGLITREEAQDYQTEPINVTQKTPVKDVTIPNPPQTITQKQHKSIEAMSNQIAKTYDIDKTAFRDRLKSWVKSAWNIDHFPELPVDKFQGFIGRIEAFGRKMKEEVDFKYDFIEPYNDQVESNTLIDENQHREIEAFIKDNKLNRSNIIDQCKQKFGVNAFEDLKQMHYAEFYGLLESWVDKG